MQIFFIDPAEKAVDLFHPLKLYPASPQIQLSTKKPVVYVASRRASYRGHDAYVSTGNTNARPTAYLFRYEFYEQIMFKSPTEVMRKALECTKDGPEGKTRRVGSTSETAKQPIASKHFTTFSEADDLRAVLAAHDYVVNEVSAMRERLLRAEAGVLELRAAAEGSAMASAARGGKRRR